MISEEFDDERLQSKQEKQNQNHHPQSLQKSSNQRLFSTTHTHTLQHKQKRSQVLGHTTRTETQTKD